MYISLLFKGIGHPKMKICWQFTHPQAMQDVDEFVSFRSDLEKFTITSLAHQWILCGEWVPSEWVQIHKNITIIHPGLQTCNFSLNKTLTDGLEWCGLLVGYYDVFISCLDSHSDGTHSLQRIHWWASEQIVIFEWTIHLIMTSNNACNWYIFLRKFICTS